MMGILEKKWLMEALKRIEQLEAEVIALKANQVAWDAEDVPVRRGPGRPKKQVEAQA